MKIFASLFVLTLLKVSSWAESPQNGTRQCSGTLGPVTNVMIRVTNTDMSVSYDPPSGYEGCNMDYKIRYWNGVNLATYQATTTKNLYESYNYFGEHVLCKLVNLDITPIFGGFEGETYQTNQFTDKFDDLIDIGLPRNLRLQLTNVLVIKWWSPIDYDSCSIVFNIEITDVDTGNLLKSDIEQGFEYRYDYVADNANCKNILVRVESMFRGVSGGSTSSQIKLSC